MVATVVDRLSTSSAPGFSNTLMPTLLAAMDMRSSAGNASAVEAVEGAALSALAAFCLKLSEKAFKPLFIRLQEWAAAAKHGAQSLEEMFFKLLELGN